MSLHALITNVVKYVVMAMQKSLKQLSLLRAHIQYNKSYNVKGCWITLLAPSTAYLQQGTRE